LHSVYFICSICYISGYTAALNGLALSLTDGSSDNNLTQAFHYFNKSAAGGNADGLYNSGIFLYLYR